MEMNRENLEKTLKIHMDKMKFKLCLNSYENSDYEIRLSDHIASDSVIQKGDIVTVKVQTDLFLASIEEAKRLESTGQPSATSKKLYEFNKLLEQCLNVIPRMFESLAHKPAADVLAYNKGKRKFRRYTYKQYDRAFPPSKYEKEITTNVDFRATIIHWKSGYIVRELGRDAGSAIDTARRRIFGLLDEDAKQDDEIEIIESHEDVIFDILLWAKTLTTTEVEEVINKLRKEHGL